MKKTAHFLPTLLLLIAIQFFLPGCDDPDENSPPDPVVWVQDPTFEGLYNSKFVDGNILANSPSNFYKFPELPISGSITTSNFGLYQGHGALRFPLHRDIIATRDRNVIYLTSVADPYNANLADTIDIPALDEHTSPYWETTEQIQWWQSECMTFTDNNYLLAPYQTIIDNQMVHTPSFVLAKLDVDPATGEVILGSYQLLKNDFFSGVVAIRRLKAIGNYFFLVIGPFTFRIDTEGNMVQVSEKEFHSIWKIGEKLFAFYVDNNTDFTHYMQSDDGGVTWTQIGIIPVPEMAGVNVTTIQSRMILYGGKQIFELAVTGDQFAITELDNEGLDGFEITSITEAGDQVFITTACNNMPVTCGGFYKPLANFFTPLPDE